MIKNGSLLRRLVTLSLLPLMMTSLAQCSAAPPAPHEGQSPGLGQGPYPSLARCSPAAACPGPGCAENIIGPPDGVSLDLGSCPILDLVFSSGIVIARRPEDAAQPELIIHLGSIAGLSMIEASSDGSRFITIGYLASSKNDLPLAEKDVCFPQLNGNQAGLFLKRCQSITNVGWLRVVHLTQQAGAPTIDAVEAISFAPSTR